AALLSAAGSLARGGVLVRQLQALEGAAAIDTVVFDKTGTLTQEGLRVASVRCREGVASGDALTLAAAIAAHSRHPVSQALVRAGEQLDKLGVASVHEHPGAGLEASRADGAVLRLGSAAFCGVHASE